MTVIKNLGRHREEVHQDEGEAHQDEEAHEAEEEDGELGVEQGQGLCRRSICEVPLSFRIDPYRLRTDRLSNQRDYGNLSQLFHSFCSNSRLKLIICVKSFW
jgi:hypothetical protein